MHRLLAVIGTVACASTPEPSQRTRRPPPAHAVEASPPPRVNPPVAAPALTAANGLSSTPLFECYEVSFAWGTVFNGFVVDDAGRVWSYDRARGRSARDVTWNPKPTSEGRFDGAALRAKFLQAESHLQLPLVIVKQREASIRGAGAGQVSSTHAAFDAGNRGCLAYLWATETEYETVELGNEGEMTVKNSAPEARELASWLWDIRRALPPPP